MNTITMVIFTADIRDLIHIGLLRSDIDIIICGIPGLTGMATAGIHHTSMDIMGDIMAGIMAVIITIHTGHITMDTTQSIPVRDVPLIAE